MADPESRLSNARHYEFLAGRLCPKCGADHKHIDRLEPASAGFVCNSCCATWPPVPVELAR